MPRLAEETKLERRQRLIEAAWRCVASQPFQSLTVDDICFEAGVSKGAFYVYFQEKQDLLLALLDDEGEGLESVLEDLEASGSRGTDRLSALTRAMLEWGQDPARRQIRSDLWSEMSSDPKLRERFAAVVARRRLAFRSWIQESVMAGELEDIPANALASILVALGDGLMLHAGLDPTAFRWSNVERALDAMLEGIEHS
ncbi:MAG: TetR/AcrR family transcriptional regulator [Actinomycetota bacterium]